MNELTDDELEQAAGGRVYEISGPGWWVAGPDYWHSGAPPEGKTFSTEEKAEDYAREHGWITRNYY